MPDTDKPPQQPGDYGFLREANIPLKGHGAASQDSSADEPLPAAGASELPLADPQGVKSKNRPGGMNVGRLKGFIDRVEKLEEERKAIGCDIKDVYSDAKGCGYDVKTIRKLVQLRRMDAADRAEQETLLDTYKHALGMI